LVSFKDSQSNLYVEKLISNIPPFLFGSV